MKINGVRNGKLEIIISKTEQERILTDERYREYVFNNIAYAIEDAKSIFIKSKEEDEDNDNRI